MGKKEEAKRRKEEEEKRRRVEEEAKRKSEEAEKKQKEEEERKAAEQAKGYKTKEAALAAIDEMMAAVVKVKGGFKDMQKELKGLTTRNVLYGPAIEKARNRAWPVVAAVGERHGFEAKLWHLVVLDETMTEFAKE